MSDNLMEKKNYDLEQITRLLLEMRDNCAGGRNVYDDPKRMEKYDALNDVVDLINNPSMLVDIVSAKDGHCEQCNDGCEVVPFVFADDEEQEIHYADYCPMCGRYLT